MTFETGDLVQVKQRVIALALRYGRRNGIRLDAGTLGVVESKEQDWGGLWIYHVMIPGRTPPAARRHGRPAPLARLHERDLEPASALDRFLHSVASNGQLGYKKD